MGTDSSLTPSQQAGPANPRNALPAANAGQAGRISPKANDAESRYRFWQLLAAYSNLTVAIVGFIALVWSINNNTSSLRANVQNAILTHVADLDRVFIERPYLYKYFYEDARPNPKDQHYSEIIPTAQLVADVLDVAAAQSTRFRGEWEDPDAWDRWAVDMFKHSPVLRDYLDQHRPWYSKGLRDQLSRAQKEKPQRANPKDRP